jgi:hypothetical protein
MTSLKSKRKRTNDEWDLPNSIEHSPESSPDYPERKLWCEVLKQAIHLAMRGNDRARFWVITPDSAFEILCGFLGLNVTVLRSAVELCNPANCIRSRFKGNQHTRGPKTTAACAIAPDLAPPTGLPATHRPLNPLPPTPAPANAPSLPRLEIPPAPPAPIFLSVVSPDGWETRIQVDEVPLVKRRRISNASS